MTARVRLAGPDDIATIAALRGQWTPGAEPGEDFEATLADWLAAEGDRRAVWLAYPPGARHAPVLEHRREADGFLSPTLRAIPFYERAGFVVPDERAGEANRLMVRLAP